MLVIAVVTVATVLRPVRGTPMPSANTLPVWPHRTGPGAGDSTAGLRRFDLQRPFGTFGGMIAVGKIRDTHMTVREVMDAINARAKSTVTRLIESGVLEAEELPGHGWLVSRTSVSRFLRRDAKTEKKVGRPRGMVMKKDGASPAKAG